MLFTDIEYVYFLEAAGDPGFLKIGYSSNVAARIFDIQLGNRRKLIPHTTVAFPRGLAQGCFETSLHRVLHHKRQESEWFEFPKQHILDLCKGALDIYVKRIVPEVQEQLQAFGEAKASGNLYLPKNLLR